MNVIVHFTCSDSGLFVLRAQRALFEQAMASNSAFMNHNSTLDLQCTSKADVYGWINVSHSCFASIAKWKANVISRIMDIFWYNSVSIKKHVIHNKLTQIME